MTQKQGKKDKTTVRRIKAKDDAPKKSSPKTDRTTSAKTKTAKTVIKKESPKTKTSTDSGSKNPLKTLGGYFKGAWAELKLVRWPTRSATWAMTAAVLIFCALLGTLILLLDAGFNWLFELMFK